MAINESPNGEWDTTVGSPITIGHPLMPFDVLLQWTTLINRVRHMLPLEAALY